MHESTASRSTMERPSLRTWETLRQPAMLSWRSSTTTHQLMKSNGIIFAQILTPVGAAITNPVEKARNLPTKHHCDVVKPVFETLSKTSLLSRFMRGLTQNSNECIHSMMWCFAPKHILNGPNVMLLAAALGTGIFNDGHVFIGKKP